MSEDGAASAWYRSTEARGFLLDIYGVLYDVGEQGEYAIEGSIDAITSLRSRNIPHRFCSNTSNKVKQALADKLKTLGFSIDAANVFPPAPAVAKYLRDKGLRPHLLVDKAVLPEFDGIDTASPNCVVLGDAPEQYTPENLNLALQVLLGAQQPALIAMGGGRYYSDCGKPVLDVGSYAKALEFASDTPATVIGKPSAEFFLAAADDMGLKPGNVVMVGDDIVSDVGGAQACGMIGVQVRTGKYRPSYEPHTTVKPDGYVDNLLEAVNLYLDNH